MGCDIHFFVEKKNPETQAWELVYPRKGIIEIRDELIERGRDLSSFPGRLVDTWEEYEEVSGSYADRSKDPLYVGRNYNLFSMLADVRNGRGFAGVLTGDGFNPIALPRGVPEDASPSYRWASDGYDDDGHSHSWLTLRELLDYNWDQTTKLSGLVTPIEYMQYKEKGSPSSWCGGAWGLNVVHVTPEEMEAHIASGVKDDTSTMFCQVEWAVTYRECAGRFLTETVPELNKLGDSDNVRIAFFFDN